MPTRDIPPAVWQALGTVAEWHGSDDGGATFRYRAHAAVDHVEDGDTWRGKHKPDPQVEVDEADGVWYRLSRVDTHETDAGDDATRRRAEREKAFTEEWIEEGRDGHDGAWPFVIEYESEQYEGPFGRLLVDLVRKTDGAELNDALLAAFGDGIRWTG